MDLLKTPSVQSLLDSDLESVDSLQYLDIEELDEVEYALPASEAPTLAEVLLSDEVEDQQSKLVRPVEEFDACSALQVDFLQALSQQLVQAQERSSTGVVTTLGVAKDGRLTVGTAHGHLLSFFEQILRWVCDSNADCGAVSCLSYNSDATRLLAGYARGLICQYESTKGLLLRRVTLGGEIWGILRVTWAGTAGLALDTGGSVWLIKFSRPLGVRSARTSCLFSGARGEVVAMKARDARILALATLSRVIIVAGGRAAGVRLGGPPDTLPVLEWCETDPRILICARSITLQWLSVNITGSSIALLPIKRAELKTTPLWLGWLGGSLAIFDSDENLRLWGDDYSQPLDLSHIEPVYASAFFKGVWTDGRVSRAMCTAGVSALGGACVADSALALLGRRGIVRVRPRDMLARVHALIRSGYHLQALKLLELANSGDAENEAKDFINHLAQRPNILGNKKVADQVIKLCLKYNLREELWCTLWEQCSSENAFVEALGDAVVMCKLTDIAPAPDATQQLIERLADFEPGLVERVIASLPLTSLDPHRASVFAREKKLWRAVGAVAAALGGSSGAMRSLVAHVSQSCGGGAACACAGAALVLAAADALAGRGAGGRPLPDHARPSARHDALHTLLADESGVEGRSPLRVLVEHDAAAAVRLLEQSALEPPFTGPLGKQNRLRIARALLAFTPLLEAENARVEVLEFITGQLSSGSLPSDAEVLSGALQLALRGSGERADRAARALLLRRRDSQLTGELSEQLKARSRVLWWLEAQLGRQKNALEHFFKIETPSGTDLDELFEYVRTCTCDDGELFAKFSADERIFFFCTLVKLRPCAAAALIDDDDSTYIVAVFNMLSGEGILEFGNSLLKSGRLRGDAAAAHLRNLCTTRPGEVKEFLTHNPGIVRPEDALAIVRETKVEDAEADCLEANGDFEAALETLLRRLEASDDDEAVTAFAARAGALCARAAAALPRVAAAALWDTLLRRAPALPPAALLEAAAYLPVDTLVSRTCDSTRAALTLAACADTRRRGWQCASRIAGREAHAALARALGAAGRGLPVRGRCVRCGRRLASEAVRTQHCARAVHASCTPEPTCGACGARVPADVAVLPARPPRRVSPPSEHTLVLLAPPRPDLEGII
ncbi:vacuolar protein sorting-associated protein 8 homolog [Amyelois transitella]|uniref:vacuolar protein sorting-associated protein 8 homolog n=1 Tax=Amyelois transitella TaxID=680683 RepID=UPI00298FE14F|nr:vacuolar protein sorting-associated protein 8 homolog [Amyelois transitella]